MYKGKAIYQPTGKAGEYAAWACNFYVGCSNGCTYCYCKKGILAGTMGQDKPQLKKCFQNKDHALDLFYREVDKNINELKKHGLFFSFTTDPMLPDTIQLTKYASDYAINRDIPVQILSKRTDWIERHVSYFLIDRPYYAFGFTLTGHDELEPGASTNQERINAMIMLHSAGFKTFASIEPVIDFPSARNVIKATLGYCDLYKIGLMAGKKYDVVEAQTFVEWLNELEQPKIYLKQSLQKLSRYTNAELDEYFVNSDYNIFAS